MVPFLSWKIFKSFSFSFLSFYRSSIQFPTDWHFSDSTLKLHCSLEHYTRRRRFKIGLFLVPAYRSVGIYTCCSAAGPANDTSNFVGDWIRSEEVDFLVGVGIHSRPSHDPLVRVPLSGKRRRRSCKGIRLRIRNDKILTKRVSPSPLPPPLFPYNISLV